MPSKQANRYARSAKRGKGPLIAAFVAIAVVAIGAFVLLSQPLGQAKGSTSPSIVVIQTPIKAATTPAPIVSATPAATTASTPATKSLVIPVSAVSSTVTFYPVTVNGTKMEVLAVKAPDGTIRTAFNTCQVCYDSGRGYYKQEGNVIVCQNCGNRFRLQDIEVVKGGCNPVPILKTDKAVTSTSITIGYDALSEASELFTNWKY